MAIVEKITIKKERGKSSQPEMPRQWYFVDAKGKILGRLATRIATVLMGKHKPTWLPYLDRGDNVIVINSAKVEVTGRKEENKKYYRYSGYPGGLKVETMDKVREKNPNLLISHAVKGMMPKSRLGKAMIKKLYVYPGEKHPHDAQKPIDLEIG